MFLAAPGDLFEAIGPVVATIAVFSIPIIAILTAHQRKMTELLHRNNPQHDVNTQAQLAHMQRQIDEIKGLLQEHIIAQDSKRAAEQQLQQRVQ